LKKVDVLIKILKLIVLCCSFIVVINLIDILKDSRRSKKYDLEISKMDTIYNVRGLVDTLKIEK
jgi:fibrillarin-like rRNA methylase